MLITTSCCVAYKCPEQAKTAILSTVTRKPDMQVVASSLTDDLSWWVMSSMLLVLPRRGLGASLLEEDTSGMLSLLKKEN